MAIYIEDVRNVPSPLNPDITNGSDKPIVDFNVDTAADIANLPGLDQVRGGSSAFVIATSEVHMLGSTGYKKI